MGQTKQKYLDYLVEKQGEESMKNDGTYFLAIVGSKKYPEQVYPFTWEGLYFFVSAHYTDDKFSRQFIATEKQSGHSIGTEPFSDVESAKNHAIDLLTKVGKKAVIFSIAQGLAQNKQWNVK